MTDTIGSMPARIDQQQLAQQLVDSAREDGVELVGPGGLLTGLTKTVLETALEAELDEHLGYEKHQIEGRDGGNSRNGTRYPATGTARSTRNWCASASGACPGSTRSCSRSRPAA